MESNAELDRVIGEQVDRVSAVTTRSAGLTAAVVLAGSILVAQVQAKIAVHWWVVVSLGLATLAGVVVMVGTRLSTGPGAETILEWSVTHPSQLEQLVCVAKAEAAGGNERRIRVVDTIFYVQAVLAGVSVLLAWASLRSW